MFLAVTTCEPCSERHKQTKAIKWCSDCEESLCKECAECHLSMKATKYHHVVDLKVAHSFPSASDCNLPSRTSKCCTILALNLAIESLTNSCELIWAKFSRLYLTLYHLGQCLYKRLRAPKNSNYILMTINYTRVLNCARKLT
jgi:hypothetical protein